MSSLHTIRAGGLSVRVSTRVLLVAVSLLAVLLLLSVVTLLYGTFVLTTQEVWDALWGQGQERAVRTVQGRRLPRLLAAIFVGASLGVSGAIMQSVSRNPLGSPDIIGFTGGAAAGAIAYITTGGESVILTALAAIGGGIVTSLLVYALARRDGVTGGFRLILVGIGVSAIATAITHGFVVRAELGRALNAQMWQAGNLVGRGWPHVTSLMLAFLVLIGPAIFIARRLAYIEMGDDLALGVGIPVERTRFIAVLLAVLLMAVAVATTGPIAFIALAAPQIARRLNRRPGIPIGGSILVGATLLVVADLASQAVDVGVRTPVGTVTALVGGLYLIWLLARRA